MEHFTRLLPSLPKRFDHSSKQREAEFEARITPDTQHEEPQVSPEEDPLATTDQSHENLAFEDENPPKLQDSSMESTESDKVEKEGDDSGIVDSDVDGKDVSVVLEGTAEETQEDTAEKTQEDTAEKTQEDTAEKTQEDTPEEQGSPAAHNYQPILKSIGTFAVQFMAASPPEIKVDKPKTLFSVATGEGEKPAVTRRHTEQNIFQAKGKNNTLLPEMANKRRHSDFAVSAPRPINDELAEKDMKSRGSAKNNKTAADKVDAKQARKRSQSPDVISATRGPRWSPRLERKKREEERTVGHKEERRKTLAELAMEAGYGSSVTDGKSEVKNIPPVVNAETLTVKETNESLLSEPDEEHYGGIQVTGEIFVSLRYEMKSNKFEVHVHSANNLAAADAKKGSSDPYVKSYLLPDKRSKRKTKTKKDTLNPVFDEILEYFIGYDELLTRTLFLSVWHKVIGRNEFLGEVKIHMNDFLEAGLSLQEPTAKWFILTGMSADTTDGLPSSPAELVLALKYVTADKVKKRGRNKGELHVHLLEARNLPGMDADGMSDPYCKCYLLPDKKGKSKHKTPVVKRTLNPSFDYKFACEEVSPDDLKERVLEITIWDFDRASSDEFLGGVRLGLGTSPNEWDDATEDESQIWHTMLSRSNVWIQVLVPLRSSMTLKKKLSGAEN